jgi:ppGpp synthetase/RelA/SpoT-type nucleotidyltranferase/predicted MPP superfamily phosphohydrolase
MRVDFPYMSLTSSGQNLIGDGAVIRILHVSDVHFGVNDPRREQARITGGVIEAVKRDKLAPDIIVFSGDLAFNGAPKQFKTGEGWLWELCQLAPQADLFVVPGNHDVDQAKAPLPNLLHAAGSNEQSFEEWKKQEVLNRGPRHLEDFFAWAKSASNTLPLKGDWTTRYGFHFTKNDLEIPVHIIGLNSALLSCDKQDKEQLVIDVGTANESLQRSKEKPGLIVAVAHHPFEWLRDWNKILLEQFISQDAGADIFLHGHLHTQLGVAKSEITGKSLVTLEAGAAYQGSNWPQQFGMYAIEHYHGAMYALQTSVYTYSRDSGEWVIDNKLSTTLHLILTAPPSSEAVGAAEIVHTLIEEKHVVAIEPIATKNRNGRATPDRGDNIKSVKLARSKAEIDLEIHQYRDAAYEVEEKVDSYFGDNSDFNKICYAIKHRVKNRDRIRNKMQEKGIHDASHIVDICGFRLITFYQRDIPIVVGNILKVIETEDHPKSPFKRGCQVEIDINTSRPEGDPLSITEAVLAVAARSPLHPQVVVRSRPTGYSSVHMVVLAPTAGGDHDVPEMFLELQIRSAWEDIWGEVDHRLRYGSERGSLGVSWNYHLNAFKALIDGIVQYADVIKQQSEESTPPKPPSAIKVEKTIAKPTDQLERLNGLRPDISNRVFQAFELWKQADASRQRGGDTGLLRQAADAFSAILSEFKGEPSDNPNLADELEYVAGTERAYLLMYTGDDYDLAQAAELYEKILAKRQNDATALFRLGVVKRRQKQYEDSDRLLTQALVQIEAGTDDRIDVKHPAYDRARLSLGLTRWRIFDRTRNDRGVLNSAINLARDVTQNPVDPENSIRAVNDLLYYGCEERDLSIPVRDLLVSEAEFGRLTTTLENDLKVQDRSFEYHDTLLKALETSGRRDVIGAAALKLRDVLEQAAVLRAPAGSDVGKHEKGSYAWAIALSRYLDDDQKECLAHAQDALTGQ